MFHHFAPYAPSTPSAEPAGTPQEQLRGLLSRYPNLSETELARMINLYRGISALDAALMLSDPAIAPTLDRFTSEHRSKVRPPFRHYAGLLVYAAMAIATVAWAISVVV